MERSTNINDKASIEEIKPGDYLIKLNKKIAKTAKIIFDDPDKKENASTLRVTKTDSLEINNKVLTFYPQSHDSNQMQEREVNDVKHKAIVWINLKKVKEISTYFIGEFPYFYYYDEDAKYWRTLYYLSFEDADMNDDSIVNKNEEQNKNSIVINNVKNNTNSNNKNIYHFNSNSTFSFNNSNNNNSNNNNSNNSNNNRNNNNSNNNSSNSNNRNNRNSNNNNSNNDSNNSSKNQNSNNNRRNKSIANFRFDNSEKLNLDNSKSKNILKLETGKIDPLKINQFLRLITSKIKFQELNLTVNNINCNNKYYYYYNGVQTKTIPENINQ